MDSIQRNLYNHHGFHALSPIKSQQQLIYRTSSHSPETSSPILIIAILGIITTAFLLIGYYIFVIKCWLNWHRIGVIRRFSFRRYEDPLMVFDPVVENRGVDESIIRAIPIFQFKRRGDREGEEGSFHECSVCLNEFQEEEKLRVLPSCGHSFHIDCIDIWLQNNDNCPLCRSSISTTTRFPLDQIIAPSSSPQDQTPFSDTVVNGDDDFVVIEIMGNDGSDQITHRPQERAKSGELLAQSINPSPRKLEQKPMQKKARKFHHVSSMGDECIDIRGKDDQFSIQPIRRSISMDSSVDRQLYLTVQEIIQQNRQLNEVSTSEGCSSRVSRSFFSFGHGRGSKSAVNPIEFE
ncbi:zinc finger protein [Macleaya cordata]|uniref:RING-type E3 ubiquitin transferase n=1 Tax=Macleaya cordata TaxID=56857 RepID=A0A200PW33_MACCD|nr:zinc finger protein [Macleaya cordata]